MKRLFKLLIVVICFITLNACNIKISDKNTDNSQVDLDSYVLMSAAEKVKIDNMEPSVNDSYQEFLRKLQIFSAKLSVSAYKDSDKTKNLCISPISVYMALAMTITNASGVAKDELLNAVGVTEDEVDNFTKYLYSSLKQERYVNDDTGQRKLTSVLDLNNSIWFDDSISLKVEGLNNLANNFMADSYKVSFKNDNKKANELLSKYIDIKTRGLIKPELQLSEDTLFALVNTLYMKDFWAGCDDKLNFTKSECDFIPTDGEIIKKLFLESPYYYGRVIEKETYKHFYVCTDGGYKLKLFIPNDGYSLSDIFTVDNLVEINRTKQYNVSDDIGACVPSAIEHHTRTIFPAFEANYNKNLVEIFKTEFNVSNVFAPGKHMTGLTDIDNLFIDSIIHQTKLKVDETGVEGAAVTIMAATGESCAPIIELHDFLIDRAFGYLLIDKYGNVLFSGVVNTI
jgi:serpin B